jgi:hypothetical protein
MLPVDITVSVGTRKISVDELSDRRLASALRTAGQDIARKIDGVLCPVHGKKAARVRIHFDHRGGADLQYDSCCEKLGAKISATLGQA